MMRVLLFSTVLFANVTLAHGGEEFAPKPFGIERYEHIWQQSPFVVETPVVQQSAGLEQRFALTGVASLNAAPVIFVLDRQSLSRIIVTQGKNAQNIELVSVETNPDPRKASAIIKVGAEQGVIRYDPGALQTTGQTPDASGKGNAPNTAQAPTSPVQPTPTTAQNLVAQTSSPPPTPPASTKIIRRRPIDLHH
jgi:hypothetical protein